LCNTGTNIWKHWNTIWAQCRIGWNCKLIMSVFWTGNLLRGVPEVDECDSSRSVTRRKRHATHNLDRFGPRGA
jgi:hypothetical protein